jgi:uncharacterized protein
MKPVDSMAVSTRLVESLREQFERQGVEPVLIETHISWVLLAGEFAYKIKKPVQLGFLDFTSLDARRHFCAEELRLNQRMAPGLYVAVVPIHGNPQAPSWDGSGPAIEYAVKMHRMSPDALASVRLARDELTANDLVRFAQRLHEFHRAAPAAEPGGEYATPLRIAADAQRTVAALPPGEPAAVGEALRQWFDAQAAVLAPAWTERLVAGRVRECHGDLHLDNVVVLEHEVTAFDCLEFDAGLRWIDVMNDVAFLTMDLHAHGRPDLASVFLNAYLEAGGDYAGLPVLRFYMVGRALVRGMVAALREGQGSARATTPGARQYLGLAQRLSHQWDPRLLITHGLPGSGKTFVSGRLLERTGAIRVRSDVERARLLGRDRYDAADTAQVYGRLGAVARVSLSSGYPTIVDAACLKRAERDALRAVAEALGAPFAILDCTAPVEVLRQRVRDRQRRGDDASQADEAVLELLLARQEPLDAGEAQRAIPVDTQQPIAIGAVAAAWLRATPPAHG